MTGIGRLTPRIAMLLTSIAILVFLASSAWPARAEGVALPAFTQTEAAHWINSEPLRADELRGQVLLIDVWTSDCWNCYRSFPWLRALEKRLADQAFRVIGIHSPEFDHERDIDRVRRKVAEFGLQHAVMIDNDFTYWRALGNRYWPAYYLVDKRGFVREIFVGETHEGDAQSRQIAAAIDRLLTESP